MARPKKKEEKIDKTEETQDVSKKYPLVLLLGKTTFFIGVVFFVWLTAIMLLLVLIKLGFHQPLEEIREQPNWIGYSLAITMLALLPIFYHILKKKEAHPA